MAAETLDQARERLRPYVERARGFSGWTDFPETKRLGPAKPWHYMARARELLTGATAVLDMGTGGGERFADLCRNFKGRAVATEEWRVNVPAAAATLRPLGAAVVHASSLRLPFAAASFDLVLNRHEDLGPSEIARVLKPGGALLTQQVPRDNWRELVRFFARRTDFGDHFTTYQRGLRGAGLTIVEARVHETPVAYDGLGDFAYNLCVAAWEVPDFDPLGCDLGGAARHGARAIDAGRPRGHGGALPDRSAQAGRTAD